MNEGNFWGELIVQLRQEAGYSQRQLANGAKVNRSTLRRLEEGKTSGDIDMVGKLLDFMGYELEVMVKTSLQERLKKRAAEAADPSQRSRLAAARLLAAFPGDIT